MPNLERFGETARRQEGNDGIPSLEKETDFDYCEEQSHPSSSNFLQYALYKRGRCAGISRWTGH